MAVVQRVHQAFKLNLAEGSRAAMQAHVDANPKGKHGKHEYDLAEYGLTRELIQDRFAFYTDDKRWPISD
jgi:hypothetical protein